MNHPKYCMFFDNHTMKACPDIAQDFNPDLFANRLSEAGVDFIGFHAKCNQGFCYYDTGLGIRHPGLKPGYDLFGEVIRSCAKYGIAVSAYLNCGLSNENAIEHPEWACIFPDGRLLHNDLYNFGWISPYTRIMCFNSPYRNYLLKLIAEVQAQYPVAGFLLDSFNSFPCICPHCVEGMRKLDMDPNDPAAVEKFAKLTSVRMAAEISEMIRSKTPDLLLNFLGVSVEDNLRWGTYLEFECIPTVPCWGYGYLPLMARHLRTLAVPGQPVLNMTGRFYDWGDFGSLRTAAALEYDLFFGLANGMRPNIGDHFHPREGLRNGVFRRVKEVYDNIRRYEPWFEGAVPVTEIGLVMEGLAPDNESLGGAVRMLSEEKLQFDVLTAQSDWSRYSLLVLPDSISMMDPISRRLRSHLEAGKGVISTGSSGLNEARDAFEFADFWGLDYAGECQYDPVYFHAAPPYGAELPDLPLAVHAAGGSLVRARQGTTVGGYVVAPYYNAHWDGIYSYYYTPPDKETKLPFITRKNHVLHCPFRLFAGYQKTASVELRQVFRAMVRELLPVPLLEMDCSLPSFARAFVSAKPQQRIVHLLNYVPELRGKMLLIEEGVKSCGIRVSLRLDGATPRAVREAPEGKMVPFESEGGRVHFTTGTFTGYGMYVVELEAME